VGNFFLCIVKNVSTTPVITLTQNPASKINPGQASCTTIEINWSMTENILKQIDA
jgi:hypothetical protein